MYEAANDLLQYYEAGTFVHALVSLQAQAGAHVTNCKQQVKNLKTTGTPTGVSTDPTISGDPTISPATGANPFTDAKNGIGDGPVTPDKR